MNKMIVFGDIHLDWEAEKVILDEARNQGIDTALTLGDEDSFVGAESWVYDKICGSLRDFRDEREGRELICCIGDKTGGIRHYLNENYVGVGKGGKISGSVVFRRDNIIAAHNGKWILKEYGEFIRKYKGAEPLVVFHGHSHSMGVLPEYKWLKPEELVYSIPEGKRTFRLEPSKTYWVNPGARGSNIWGKLAEANFAIYDPQLQTIDLVTKLFQRTRF